MTPIDWQRAKPILDSDLQMDSTQRLENAKLQ